MATSAAAAITRQFSGFGRKATRIEASQREPVERPERPKRGNAYPLAAGIYSPCRRGHAREPQHRPLHPRPRGARSRRARDAVRNYEGAHTHFWRTVAFSAERWELHVSKSLLFNSRTLSLLAGAVAFGTLTPALAYPNPDTRVYMRGFEPSEPKDWDLGPTNQLVHESGGGWSAHPSHPPARIQMVRAGRRCSRHVECDQSLGARARWRRLRFCSVGKAFRRPSQRLRLSSSAKAGRKSGRTCCGAQPLRTTAHG